MTQPEKDDIVGVSGVLSNDAVQLYKSASVQTAYEGFTVIIHSFMLERGFLPKDIVEKKKLECMPENWKGKVLFKLFYSHPYCPSFTCCLTCVPLYQNMSIQGTVGDADCSESVNIKIQMGDYLKEKKKFSGSLGDFKNLKELSQNFKDGFCLPLLNLLCETAGSSRLFGLPGMVDEMKIYLLKLLPVKDVVSMSAVNKKFHFLANLPELWKYMFLRDFSKGGKTIGDSSSSLIDWKQKYKEEYLKMKNSTRERRFSMHPYVLEPDDIDFHIGYPQIFDPFEPSPYIFPPLMPPRLPFHFRRLI